MVNNKFLMKTTTDLLSELSQLKNDYSNSIRQVNQLLDDLKNEKKKNQELFDSFKQFAQEELRNEHDKLIKSFQTLKK